jgi:MFS family permease
MKLAERVDSGAGNARRDLARSLQTWLERPGAPVAIFAAALLAAAALLLYLVFHLTFFQDTWEFLMTRRDFTVDAFLKPHNEHIVVIPVALQQLFLHLFGMGTALPEYVLLVVAQLVTAGLVFVYVRRRLGPWGGLIAAVLLLFVGPAWQDMLWPFEIGFVGSVLFGIAMLLMLERADRRGDVAATVFLVISVGFSSLGVAFAAGALVDVLQRHRSRGWKRAYLAAVPLALYAAWYLGWGHDAESHLTVRNILGAPRFVFESLAASVDSLLGLSTTPIEGIGTPEWGRPLLILLIALLVIRQLRKPGFPARLWPAAAVALAYWLLTALNYIPGREPTTSRYLYATAALALLVAADLLRDVRFSRAGLVAACAVTAFAVSSNLVYIGNGYNWFLNQTVLTKADLTAIEIAERTVEPAFRLTPEVAGTPSLIDVEAGQYLQAVSEYGSPAYTLDELPEAPPVARGQADIALDAALPISVVASPGSLRGGRGCVRVRPGGGELRLRPGRTEIGLPAGADGSLGLRRFASDEYPVQLGLVSGGSVATLTIPRDRSAQPWYLYVAGPLGARVCAAG